MKILFSWIAQNNDFKDGELSEDSPNLTFHTQFYAHDKHIILCSALEEDTRAIHLIAGLKARFPKRDIELVYLNINDVISLEEIKPKVESLLLKYRNDEIDIFISPGTSMMQVAWFICHTSLGLKTRLLQTRPKKFTSKKIGAELLEIQTGQNKEGYSASIRESLADSKDIDADDYLITSSIAPVYKKALQVAEVDRVTCLIQGETGTGKEYLANYIHQNSARAKSPFIAINCSAMGDTLLESRLFGYKKGSFTGADKDTDGLFKQADGGTIFLDEIGDISLYMQQSLLRIFQEKEITPIGGKAQKIDVRIIAATHRNLTELCKAEKFRWDLYYRLNVVELELPALRDRTSEERGQMLHFFIKQKKTELKRGKQLKFSKEAEKLLLGYPYPGNVREMENLIESLYVFNEETIKPEDLPKRICANESETSYDWRVNEKLLIEKALDAFNGNQRKANQALGYGSINTLVKKIREYEL